MFLNNILETVNDWFDSEALSQPDSLESDSTPPSEEIPQEFESDFDHFTGDKTTEESGDNPPPRTENFHEFPPENPGYGAVSDDTPCYASDTWWNPSNFDGWGNPIADANCWQEQEGSTSCAVIAQIGVYESITGHTDISEADACRIAEANGWYDPDSGTMPENVGKILEYYGIPTEQRYDATLIDIANALEQGDKVIVGLDANEIWYPATDPVTGSSLEQSNAGHAVWVTGIDQQPDGSVKIILNDSGAPDGRMKAVDVKDFTNAWEDYGNFAVFADAPDQAIWA